MNGLVLTRAMLMEQAGFKPIRDLLRARNATLRALKAETPRQLIYNKDGDVLREIEPAPAHDIRLRAAAQVYAWHDLTGKQAAITATLTGPVTITWTPPTALESSASSLPALGNGRSTNGSNGSTSSSATGDSGKPSWL